MPMHTSIQGGFGTLSDADMYRLGQQVLEDFLSGRMARFAGDRRVRETARRIAEMLVESGVEFDPVSFLEPYFRVPTGGALTADRLREQRDLARWLAGLPGTEGALSVVQRFVPTFQPRGELSAAQRFAELAWSDFLRGLRGTTIDPRTGQVVPMFDTLTALGLQAAQSGLAAGPAGFSWAPSPAPAPAPSQPTTPAFPPSPAPPESMAARLARGVPTPTLAPPAQASAQPPDAAAVLEALARVSQPGGQSVLDRLSSWIRQRVWEFIANNAPQLDPMVEQAFQAMRPELERRFPNRQELRAIFESVSPDELARRFGSRALVNRIWQWIQTGR